MSSALSPVDVAGGPGPGSASCRPGASVSVGGRVVARVTEASLVIADAFTTLLVEGNEALPALPGDLVLVEGRLGDGPRLAEARLLEHHPAPEPRGGGEVARLLLARAGPRLAARAAALAEVRAWLREEGFLEVETPSCIPAPGLDPHVEPRRTEDGFLVPSPEHALKRLLVGGFPRVAEFARCWRADEAGAWHEPEFTLLEWYRAFAGEEAVMRDTEALVVRIAACLGGLPPCLKPPGRPPVPLAPPFPRVPVREAFREYADVADAVDLAESDPDRFHAVMVERVEPALARLPTPVFLVEYPRSQASLARLCPHDSRVAERFELWVAGIELCNGFGELTDADQLAARWHADAAERRRLGRAAWSPDARLLSAQREGLPPSAGNALGLDRLIALALGLAGVAEVRAFPWALR